MPCNVTDADALTVTGVLAGGADVSRLVSKSVGRRVEGGRVAIVGMNDGWDEEGLSVGVEVGTDAGGADEDDEGG